MSFRDYLEENFEVKEVSGGRELWLHKGECPFCLRGGDDLRIYVNEASGAGFCHHCGKGFNSLQFVQARERCDAGTARKILKGLASGYARAPEPEAKIKPEVVWPATVDLAASPEALAYLAKRGIPESIQEMFYLRFCYRNFTVGDKLYWSKNRVIIPIWDENGEPVGWQGRDITGKSRIKYLFPPGFNAGDYLFAANFIETGLLESIILVEGAFDTFGWMRHGLKNVLATFGKKISNNQLDVMLKLNPKTVYLAWDTDAAWEKHEFCEKYGHLFEVLIVEMGGRDADEMSKPELYSVYAAAQPYNWANKVLARL